MATYNEMISELYDCHIKEFNFYNELSEWDVNDIRCFFQDFFCCDYSLYEQSESIDSENKKRMTGLLNEYKGINVFGEDKNLLELLGSKKYFILNILEVNWAINEYGSNNLAVKLKNKHLTLLHKEEDKYLPVNCVLNVNSLLNDSLENYIKESNYFKTLSEEESMKKKGFLSKLFEEASKNEKIGFELEDAIGMINEYKNIIIKDDNSLIKNSEQYSFLDIVAIMEYWLITPRDVNRGLDHYNKNKGQDFRISLKESKEKLFGRILFETEANSLDAIGRQYQWSI